MTLLALQLLDEYRCPDGCTYADGEPVAEFRPSSEFHMDPPTCWKSGAYMKLERPALKATPGGEE